jgi:quercetin dioxygenase-like cupin family protein
MRYTRVFAGPDGESHFEDVNVEMNPVNEYARGVPVVDVSAPIPAAAMTFLRAPAGWVGDWHPAPRRQFLAYLAGEVEATVSDGETRRFGPGDITLVEDTTGKGHTSKVVGSAECMFLVVVLPD